MKGADGSMVEKEQQTLRKLAKVAQAPGQHY